MFKGHGKFISKKTVQRVIREIRQVKDNYVLKRVHFSDDLFVLDKKWVKEFLIAYRKEINIPFSCNVRVDRVDEIMKRYARKQMLWGFIRHRIRQRPYQKRDSEKKPQRRRYC